ncbi:ABC transporter substrate-binding protein [Streptomyces specialis]|uniref:ABC transporter substrate-binding protein n=1 Tax=Streptomyces specialis TaxID=498367 RepID=UPI00073F569E|nr:ABC transporter substrate-binding protein [Streptomyces specialis]
MPRTPATRRAFLATGGSLAAGTLLAACSGGTGSGDGRPASGGWSFTDDRGETVERDSVPERIVAYVGSAAALHDYGVACVGVFGPTLLANGEPDVQAANLDVGELTVVGNAWGEFNVETFAGLEPDLLVTPIHDTPELWYVPPEVSDEVNGLAPAVAIHSVDTPLSAVIDRYAELAGALGGDLGAPAVTTAKTRFTEAAEALRRATRDNPGLRVLAVPATDDMVWFASPDRLSDLSYYRELGVELISPGEPDGDIFATASWENVDTHPADLILVDQRTSNLQPDQLAATKPTWAALPAVRAGQVASWNPEPTHSHAGCAPALEALADAIRNATRLDD